MNMQLRQALLALHKKGYPAYKSLRGTYKFDRYILSIDHVQGDPFASPSNVSVIVSRKDADFPAFCYESKLTKVTLADYLIRQFEKQISKYTFQAKGSGKSGLIEVSHCGQEVLERTACEVNEKEIIVRFCIGFPANGRTINAIELEKILFDYVPACVERSLFYKNLKEKQVEQVIFLAKDQAYIREQLKERGFVAFVADGAILPRESGVSKRPMKRATPFQSPESLCISMELPYKGTITGMGIKEGITLIVGGGYHGKSTLLHALDVGVYNHILGDGREYVITDDSALKLRSEDGRFIKDVDISLFINDLPNQKDTTCFSTEDASGSTSQAAGIVEGIEAGAHLFLLDEDTSATNFMVRDAFMQEVILQEKEPITPFLERARDLYEKAGISTVLVAGSSGAFFHIADTVIQMDNYIPVDITKRVKLLCEKYPIAKTRTLPFVMPKGHRMMASNGHSIERMGREKNDDEQNRKNEQTGEQKNGNSKERYRREGHAKKERLKMKVHGGDGFSIGKQEVDLRYIEQLIDTEQTASLGLLLKYAVEHMANGERTISQIIQHMQKKIEREGMTFLFETSYIPKGYAIPRVQEIYSCFNRYRRS